MLTSILKNNKVLAVLAVAILAIELIDLTLGPPEPDIILARAAVYLLLALTIIYPKKNHYWVFQFLTIAALPLSLLLLAIFLQYKPYAVDSYSQEDVLVENLSALAVVVASIMWFVYSLFQLRKKSWNVVVLAVIIAVSLFVIGMEEVSWGQRIFNIETGEFFMQSNAQNETNLHNINTGLSERLYYSGAGVLMVLMTFYRDRIARVLKITRAAWLVKFLPSSWLFFPLALIFSIVGAATVRHQTLLFITIFAVAGLIYYIVEFTRKRSPLKAVGCAVLLTIAIFTAVSFAVIDYEGLGIRFWMYSEYLEFYISVGLLAYTIDFMFRAIIDQKSRTSNKYQRN